MNQFSRAPEYPVGTFRIFRKIRGNIHNFVFIAVVNDTGDKLLPVGNISVYFFSSFIADVVDTGN
jgi:hypothetical protein